MISDKLIITTSGIDWSKLISLLC